jgi:hypothetical protein
MSDFKMGVPGRYQISIEGFLDENWSDRLGGLRIVTIQMAGERLVTMLTGEVVDQAALLGILNALYDLHYPLLSVRRLEQA